MNKHSGSNFDDFLEKEGILEEVSALARNRLEKPDNTSGLISRFLQSLQFNNQFVLQAVGVCVFIAVGVYLGSRYFDRGVSDTHGIALKNGVVPLQVEPTFVKGVGKDVKVSPFGFGAFPKIPTDFPDQNIWNVVEKRSVHDSDGAKTLELLARVRIKLWEQGVQTKGVIMDPSSGLIYPDSGVKILPDLRLSASADSDSGQPQYNMYFDDELSQQGRISVEFLEGGIDPYKFLNLHR